MTVDRRTVLRTSAGLAALTAGGGLLAACDDAGTTTASGPSQAPTVSPSPSPSPTTAPSPVPDEVVNGSRDRPEVALTFHGQGDPALATAILRIAEQHGARLTVLAVGTWLDQQPRMAERIMSGGHELGNHTQNHLDISTMSPQRAHDEIAKCAERLQHLTGSIGRWFRPSGAQYANAMVRAQAKQVGYQQCLSYDVDPQDFADPGAEAVKQRLLSAVKRGSVVGLHMGHQGTVNALPGILDGLGRLGLQAVTASQLLA